MMFVINLWN